MQLRHSYCIHWYKHQGKDQLVGFYHYQYQGDLNGEWVNGTLYYKSTCLHQHVLLCPDVSTLFRGSIWWGDTSSVGHFCCGAAKVSPDQRFHWSIQLCNNYDPVRQLNFEGNKNIFSNSCIGYFLTSSCQKICAYFSFKKGGRSSIRYRASIGNYTVCTSFFLLVALCIALVLLEGCGLIGEIWSNSIYMYNLNLDIFRINSLFSFPQRVGVLSRCPLIRALILPSTLSVKYSSHLFLTAFPNDFNLVFESTFVNDCPNEFSRPSCDIKLIATIGYVSVFP